MSKPWEKESRKAYMKAWVAAHRDKVNGYARKHYAENREKISARRKELYSAEKSKAYRFANQERISEYMKRYRLAHRDEILERQRKYRLDHHGEIAAWYRQYLIDNQKRYAEKQAALRAVRKELGLTQAAAAKILGVTQPSVCQWENGYAYCDVDALIKKLKEAVVQ